MSQAVIEHGPPSQGDLFRHGRAAWRRLGIVLFGGVLLLHGRPAAAQTLPTVEGLKAGHFVLYPSLALEYTRDDNVFYAPAEGPSDEIVDSGIYVVRPRLLAHLPLGSGRVLWSYSPVLRSYTNVRVEQSEKFSHFSDLEVSVRPGSKMSITARDHLVRGTVELREVDPGGEVTFGLVPFTVHEPEINVTLDLAARQAFSVIPRYSALRFEDEQQSGLFNYRRKGAEGRYSLNVSPTIALYGYVNQDWTDQHREETALAHVEITSRAAGIGLRRTINQAVVTTFSCGYQSMDFTGGSDTNFAGAILDATATWIMTDTTRFEIQARRQPYQSFVGSNNFYLNNYGGIRVSQQVGRSLYVVLGGSYQSNLYPEKDTSLGTRRRDKDRKVELGVGYAFNPALRVFVGYTSNRRDYKDISADYEVNRLTFRLEMGWL